MLIDNYEVPAHEKMSVRIGNSADVLVETSDMSKTKPANLVVWRGAVKDAEIDVGLQKPDWAIRVLSSLPSSEGWSWEAKVSGQKEPITDWNKILDFAAAASGVTGHSDGNMMAVLNLRTYEEKASNIGNYQWWASQNEKALVSDTFVKSFLTQLTNMLGQAYKAGADFCVEQIAVILTKDATQKAATLTPTLHSDMYYGFRETALVSLLEPGYNPYGGTIFLPAVNMRELEEHRPIRMEKLLGEFPQISVVKSQHGDIVMYDGMVGRDGKADTSNGVPHMSTDTPGASSRLVTLIRNRRVAQSNKAFSL